MTPRVTVTLPTYNRSGLLRRAIESILDQTFSDFELIVSDNGSTDDTATVVASFDDRRVVYAPLEQNVGMLGNLNRCLRLGDAPYFMMLHDDDLLRPGHLEASVAILDEHPEVVFVHSAFSMIDLDDNVLIEEETWGEPIDSMEPPAVFVRRTYWSGNRVSPSGTLVRRAAIGDETFEELDGAANDMGMWLRVARKGAVAFRRQPTLALRRHEDTTTGRLGWLEQDDVYDYLLTFEGVEMMRRVKMRFAERSDGDPVDAWRLRWLARWRARSDLGPVLRRRVLNAETSDERRELCRQAIAIEPLVLLSAAAGEAFAKTFLGDSGLRVASKVRPLARRVREKVLPPPSS